MSLTLYHVSWCPECAMVRDKLGALNAAYEDVIVPDFRPSRRQVFDVSGQYYVPVLTDGETVLTETRDILAYLDARFGGKQDGPDRQEGAMQEESDEEGPSCTL